MKCLKCGRYTVKLKDDHFYCKSCNLVYWYIVPNQKPQVFVMGDNSKQVAY